MVERRLSVGSFGDGVANLHRALGSVGLGVPEAEVAREFFGPGTREAVQWYQQQHGLTATGVADDATITALEFAGRAGTDAGVSTGGVQAAVRIASVTRQRMEACREMADRSCELLGKLLREEEHRSTRQKTEWDRRHRGRRF